MASAPIDNHRAPACNGHPLRGRLQRHVMFGLRSDLPDGHVLVGQEYLQLVFGVVRYISRYQGPHPASESAMVLDTILEISVGSPNRGFGDLLVQGGNPNQLHQPSRLIKRVASILRFLQNIVHVRHRDGGREPLDSVLLQEREETKSDFVMRLALYE